MKERPILFSAPMVRALLAGTKTQTRRIVKHEHANEIEAWHWNSVSWRFGVYGEGGVAADMGGMHCPYGVPGDRLWVRETWRTETTYDALAPGVLPANAIFQHVAEEPRRLAHWGKTRTAIHMIRRASRLTLEVTGVRVERLQDISQSDARAEGVVDTSGAWEIDGALTDTDRAGPRGAYERLWESINGPGSWVANPWVWAIDFKRVTP